MAASGTGIFITFEGPDGSGKSTQLARLAARVAASGRAVTTTREPGGTPAGERIRDVLLAPGDGLSAAAEALLFCAARAEIVRCVIRPALARGDVVLCDRYADSTLAYQGFGRRLAQDELQGMIHLATGGLRPALTLLFDLPVEEGLRRRAAAQDDAPLSRLDQETMSFHRRVRAGYLALVAAEPARWRVIDASRPPDAVAEAIWTALTPVLAGVDADDS